MTSHHDKGEYLMAIAASQSRAGRHMLEAHRLKLQGQFTAAVAALDACIDGLEEQIRLEGDHNLDFPESPMDVKPARSQLLDALRTQADLVDTLGERARASQLVQRANALTESVDGLTRADQLRQDAATLAAQSRYNQAITRLLEARDLLEANHDVLAAAQVGSQLGEIFEWLGDYARAEREARRASALLEPHLDGAAPPSPMDILKAVLSGAAGGDALKGLQRGLDQARILQSWSQLEQLGGRLSRMQGKYALAIESFQRVLPRIPQMAIPAIEFQIARTRIEAGEAQAGLAELSRLEPAFTGMLAPKVGVLRSWQAEAQLKLGCPAKALPYAELAARELEARGDLESLWSSEWRVARALVALDRRQDALRWYARAASTIAKLRRAPLGHRLDSTYLSDKLPVYDQTIELAASLQATEVAATAIEAVKSRALSAVLASPDRPGPVVSSEFEGVSRAIDAIEYEAMCQGWTVERTKNHEQLLVSRADMLERARIAEPRWRGISEPPRFDLVALKTQLGSDDCAALTLYLREGLLTAVLITAADARVASRRLAPSTLEALEAYRAALSRSGTALHDPSRAGLDAAALVPPKLLDRACAARRLVVIPHGVLHIVPWAALSFGMQRLFEYCPVSILPNASCLQLLARKPSSTPRVALIGGPDYTIFPALPELALIAEHEMSDVAAAYGDRTLGAMVSFSAATCAAFRALACRDDADGGILHVVCHGEFASGDPFNSSLVFSDGKVDAAEIAAYRMRYDEVVLSACSTGFRPTEVAGQRLTGDDVVGLIAAFLEAGVRSVVVSIAPARADATRHFMTAYHGARAAGELSPDALQKAQTAMLDSKYEPHLWASYTLYGA